LLNRKWRDVAIARARFVANSSGQLGIMAESPARAVKSLLQHGFVKKTGFPRERTRLKREDV